MALTIQVQLQMAKIENTVNFVRAFVFSRTSIGTGRARTIKSRIVPAMGMAR